jgi:hypothetical protein
MIPVFVKMNKKTPVIMQNKRRREHHTMSRFYLCLLCFLLFCVSCYESNLGLSVPTTPVINAEILVDVIESDLTGDDLGSADMLREVDQVDENVDYTSCLILHDNCPDGYKCGLYQTGEGVCVVSGVLGEGSVCGLAGRDDCNSGLLCIAADTGQSDPESFCYRGCDLMLSEGCTENKICSEMVLSVVPVEPLGFCL